VVKLHQKSRTGRIWGAG